MAQTAGGTYYAASSELVSSWPATSLDLANQLESRFAAKANASAIAVFQVKSTFKADIFTTSSGTLVDITGLSVSITPTSASNKVLVLVTLSGITTSAGATTPFQLFRGTTAIATSTGGSFSNQTLAVYTDDANQSESTTIVFLDSPATTSATTYKVQMRGNGGATAGINQSVASSWGAISTITVMEVAP